jgi:hypothetical protein
MKLKNIKKRWFVLVGIVLLLIIFLAWQGFKKPASDANWWPQLSRMPTADFNGDFVTVHNVRNYRYQASEKNPIPAYYDKTYDLTKISKVWYITDPFSEFKPAAHTFLSFQFRNGDFLSITIEARKVVGQDYSLWSGMLHTYPIMYIAADERDAVMVRANVDKDELYMYPISAEPINVRKLFVNILGTMNDLAVHPAWYNTLWANCTSTIAYEVNRTFPGRLHKLSWQLVFSGYADELALKEGLLETNLPLDQARQKYYITKRSQEVGDVSNYSLLIRKFDAK